MTLIGIFLFIILTYLVSSIPFGLVISKVICKKDVREYGSKNIGATNVTRVIGKKLGLLTLILDGMKGAIMVIIAKNIFVDYSFINVLIALVGFFAVIGHIFPLYLRFKGGKGVATTIAVIIAINPIIGLVNVLAWLSVFLITRISAVASLLSILFVNLFAIYHKASLEELLLYIALFILVLIRHKENLKRLKKGEENKI